MPVFVCKRHRRYAPGLESGTVADEWRFTASSALEAESRMRRSLPSSLGSMDWKTYFATLEDEDGQVLVTWLHSWWHG
ncbi:MAG: hypothetical protein ABI608_08435 [Rhizomicrobium sp.]